MRAFLSNRYEDLTETEITKTISRLKNIPSAPLYVGNREAFWLVNEGFDLQRDDPGKIALHVNYIDFKTRRTTVLRLSINTPSKESVCAVPICCFS